jgi:RNA polymerase sigma-70 factor (ECF subfamily)
VLRPELLDSAIRVTDEDLNCVRQGRLVFRDGDVDEGNAVLPFRAALFNIRNGAGTGLPFTRAIEALASLHAGLREHTLHSMSSSEPNRATKLLARARAGDVAARDELFRLCRNYVAVLARSQVESWLRAKVDASDLVQQTLLEAHRGFVDFQGQTEGEWLAWLKRILTHNAADFVRQYQGAKRRVGREVPLNAPVAQFAQADGSFAESAMHPPAEEPSPSVQLMAQERELHMADALTRLPEDYREVIFLRNLQRLPFDEVAKRMERSRPAAQMLWMRAIERLRQEMGPEE